jgi:hypothetical protein
MREERSERARETFRAMARGWFGITRVAAPTGLIKDTQGRARLKTHGARLQDAIDGAISHFRLRLSVARR